MEYVNIIFIISNPSKRTVVNFKEKSKKSVILKYFFKSLIKNRKNCIINIIFLKRFCKAIPILYKKSLSLG